MQKEYTSLSHRKAKLHRWSRPLLRLSKQPAFEIPTSSRSQIHCGYTLFALPSPLTHSRAVFYSLVPGSMPKISLDSVGPIIKEFPATLIILPTSLPMYVCFKGMAAKGGGDVKAVQRLHRVFPWRLWSMSEETEIASLSAPYIWPPEVVTILSGHSRKRLRGGARLSLVCVGVQLTGYCFCTYKNCFSC